MSSDSCMMGNITVVFFEGSERPVTAFILNSPLSAGVVLEWAAGT